MATGGSFLRESLRYASLVTCFLLLLLCRQHHCLLVDGDSIVPSARVAVVGAGIGGSTSSYFLRELLGEEVEIVVYDRAAKVGGRTDVSKIAIALLWFAMLPSKANSCPVLRGAYSNLFYRI